jgi:hypothetical protein
MSRPCKSSRYAFHQPVKFSLQEVDPGSPSAATGLSTSDILENQTSSVSRLYSALFPVIFPVTLENVAMRWSQPTSSVAISRFLADVSPR